MVYCETCFFSFLVGNLSTYLQNLYPQRLNEKAILAIIRDVACAIAVLHKQNPAISHKVITVFSNVVPLWLSLAGSHLL